MTERTYGSDVRNIPSEYTQWSEKPIGPVIQYELSDQEITDFGHRLAEIYKVPRDKVKHEFIAIHKLEEMEKYKWKEMTEDDILPETIGLRYTINIENSNNKKFTLRIRVPEHIRKMYEMTRVKATELLKAQTGSSGPFENQQIRAAITAVSRQMKADNQRRIATQNAPEVNLPQQLRRRPRA